MTPQRENGETQSGFPRIRGSLGEKVLRKSPELFNQGLPTVLAEVLQNARRAGASRVDIDLLGEEGKATLVVRDDGCGIADMAKLVTFGSSDWDERTDLVENAAGMGVFSLASRGVTVRSRGHRVALTREVFCGDADAVVLPDPAVERGTEIMFPVHELDAVAVITRSVRFYPVPVTVNGVTARQQSFLDGADHIVEWQGVRIGVFRGNGPDLYEFSHAWSQRTYALGLNFLGHVVVHKEPILLKEVGGTAWTAVVDVVAAPDLRLVLPARQEMIENEFLRSLRNRGERAIYECIGRQAKHSLAFKDSERSQSLGIEPPPVEIALRKWIMTSERLKYNRDSTPVVVGSYEGAILRLVDTVPIDVFAEANLHVLLSQWAGRPVLVESEPAFVGYPAYDALPVVVDVAVSATMQEGKFLQLRCFGGPDADPTLGDAMIAEDASASLVIQPGGQDDRATTIFRSTPLAFLFTSEPDDMFPGVVAQKDANPDQLANVLIDCFFQPSDDAEADSYDRQLELYSMEARDFARSLLLEETEALIERVFEEFSGLTWSLRALAGSRIEIKPERDKVKIDITTPDGCVRIATLF